MAGEIFVLEHGGCDRRRTVLAPLGGANFGVQGLRLQLVECIVDLVADPTVSGFSESLVRGLSVEGDASRRRRGASRSRPTDQARGSKRRSMKGRASPLSLRIRSVRQGWSISEATRTPSTGGSSYLSTFATRLPRVAINSGSGIFS